MKFKNLPIIVPILFCGMALSLHGYLGYFSRYMADDFCTAYYAGRLGVLRAAWFWYLNWSGRFSASILDSMVGRLGPDAVPAVVPLTIVVWVVVVTAFFLNFLHQLKNRFLVSLALTVTSLFTLFLLAPNIRQSLYWGQGMRSVVPSLLLGTIQAISWNNMRSREWTKFQLELWVILSFIWAFVAGGFSETYAAVQVAALLLSLLIILVVDKFNWSTTSMFLASGLMGAIGALTVIVLSPGNSVRQAFYPPPSGVIDILAISVKSYFLYMVHLMDSIDKVVAVVGLFSFAAMIGSQIKQEMHARLVPIISGLMLGFTFVCFLPAAYGISDEPPARTLILPTYFFLAGLIALGMVCGNLLEKKQNFVISKLLPGLAIIAITISASINSVDLYRSRSEFINYAIAWDQTDANIIKAKENGAPQILIPSIPNWASLNIPNDNPKFWVNICMSSYYDIPILTATELAPVTP